MVSTSLLLVFVLLPGKDYSFRFADDSLIPTEDDSSEICSTFQRKNNTNHLFTQFRIKASEVRTGDLQVSITGSNLGCGRNLYVSPLSLVESETWLGRWSTCQLVKNSITNNKESCSYWCRSPGLWCDLQMIRVPHSADDMWWKICHISITTELLDCSDFTAQQNGLYRIKLANTDNYTNVYCDQQTDGGGWRVLLRRVDGSVNFTRNWHDYKYGFGNLSGEFWAGNDIIHQLTSNWPTFTLRVDLEYYNGTKIYAEYSNFRIGPESDNYRLHVNGYNTNSTAEDGLSYHNMALFSTPERDNDRQEAINCALAFEAGWWFSDCKYVVLTTRYGQYPEVKRNSGIIWARQYYTDTRFAKFVVMMIRRNVVKCL